MLLKGDEWFADLAVLIHQRELEGDTWREKSHGLSGESTGAALLGIASDIFYLPSFTSLLLRQKAEVRDRGVNDGRRQRCDLILWQNRTQDGYNTPKMAKPTCVKDHDLLPLRWTNKFAAAYFFVQHPLPE
jgi:hypothetical protein